MLERRDPWLYAKCNDILDFFFPLGKVGGDVWQSAFSIKQT